MQPEDGCTIIWPACGVSGNDEQWIHRSVSPEDRPLCCGDAVIKSANCWHAGGANRSSNVRHIITLVFVNKHQYNQQNNGRIPGGNYSVPFFPSLPYRIASHHATEPNDLQCEYQRQSWGQCPVSSKVLTETIKLQQIHHHRQLLPKALVGMMRDAAASFISNPNLTFNLVDFFLPLVKPLFPKGKVAFHSISIESSPKSLDCDDPIFKCDADKEMIYIKERMIRIMMPLKSSSEWIYCCPGSKLMAMHVINSHESIKQTNRNISANIGDAVFVAGGLFYEITHEVPCVVVTFVAEDFVLSYDDRYVISDIFFSRLSK